MKVSEDIVPMAEFKTQASRLIRRLAETQRPIVVTHNGRPAAVVLTPEAFDRLNELETRVLLLSRYQDAVAAAARDDLVDDEEVWQGLEGELGPLPRNEP
jgi:prevent-host-death family protein